MAGRDFHIRSVVAVVTWEVEVSVAGELSRRVEGLDGEGEERLLEQDAAAHNVIVAFRLRVDRMRGIALMRGVCLTSRGLGTDICQVQCREWC